MKKLLATRNRKKSTEQGFSIAVSTGFGLVIMIIGLTMMGRAMKDSSVAASQKIITRSEAAAQTGATRYIAFLAKYPQLADAPSSQWTTVLPGNAEVSEYANTADWKNVDTDTSGTNGQFMLLSYTPSTDSANKIGTVEIKGRVGQNADGSSDIQTGTSVKVDYNPVEIALVSTSTDSNATNTGGTTKITGGTSTTNGSSTTTTGGTIKTTDGTTTINGGSTTTGGTTITGGTNTITGGTITTDGSTTTITGGTTTITGGTTTTNGSTTTTTGNTTTITGGTTTITGGTPTTNDGVTTITGGTIATTGGTIATTGSSTTTTGSSAATTGGTTTITGGTSTNDGSSTTVTGGTIATTGGTTTITGGTTTTDGTTTTNAGTTTITGGTSTITGGTATTNGSTTTITGGSTTITGGTTSTNGGTATTGGTTTITGGTTTITGGTVSTTDGVTKITGGTIATTGGTIATLGGTTTTASSSSGTESVLFPSIWLTKGPGEIGQYFDADGLLEDTYADSTTNSLYARIDATKKNKGYKAKRTSMRIADFLPSKSTWENRSDLNNLGDVTAGLSLPRADDKYSTETIGGVATNVYRYKVSSVSLGNNDTLTVNTVNADKTSTETAKTPQKVIFYVDGNIAPQGGADIKQACTNKKGDSVTDAGCDLTNFIIYGYKNTAISNQKICTHGRHELQGFIIAPDYLVGGNASGNGKGAYKGAVWAKEWSTNEDNQDDCRGNGTSNQLMLARNPLGTWSDLTNLKNANSIGQMPSNITITSVAHATPHGNGNGNGNGNRN